MQSSQDRLYQGYRLLVQHIPNFKGRLITQDVLELNAYFRDASRYFVLSMK
jgi:hypothetical protein